MKMPNDKKERLYKKIDEKTKAVSTPTSVHETISGWFNGFPKNLFEQWRDDCSKNYNDIYWAKIWSDHIKAQAYDTLIGGAAPGAVGSVENTNPEEQKQEEVIPMIGDGGNENVGK